MLNDNNIFQIDSRSKYERVRDGSFFYRGFCVQDSCCKATTLGKTSKYRYRARVLKVESPSIITGLKCADCNGDIFWRKVFHKMGTSKKEV